MDKKQKKAFINWKNDVIPQWVTILVANNVVFIAGHNKSEVETARKLISFYIALNLECKVETLFSGLSDTWNGQPKQIGEIHSAVRLSKNDKDVDFQVFSC